MRLPVSSSEADKETRVPEVEHRELQSAYHAGKRMLAADDGSPVVFGPRFAKEIGVRLTEGLGSGLPPAVSERLREARELAIAHRRK